MNNNSHLLTKLALAVAMAFLLFMVVPLTVLHSWTLTTDKGAYKIGEQVKMTANYYKAYDLPASSRRSIECELQNGQPNSLAKYEVYSSFSSSKVGQRQTTSYFTVPETIQQPKPAKCRMRIDLVYVVANIKPVPQSNVTNWFIVNDR